MIKIAIAIGFSLCLTITGWCKSIEVCPSCNVTSIKTAIQQAEDGDEILIGKGTYYEEQILVNKRLHIKGIDWPILDARGGAEIMTVTASGCTIEGLQFQNVGNSFINDYAALRIKKCKEFIVRNNKLINTFFGIYLEHARSGKVYDNAIYGEAMEEMYSGNAIHLWYCKNIEIRDNYVTKHRDGIYFEFVDSSLIKNNISEGNLRYGLHFMFSNDDDYFNNQFRDNGAGVAVMFSKKINMWDNVFESNWGPSSYGLLLKEIYDAEIRDNVFEENTIGIYVEGSTRVQYHYNDFIRNGWAMKISGGCLDNVVENNNFESNSFDLALNSGVNNNSFDRNYWSSYSGYDLNRDGTGDVPFRPVKLFNYVVDRTPEAMILLRSFFVDLMNFSEKVSPVLTPKNVMDNQPQMKRIRRR